MPSAAARTSAPLSLFVQEPVLHRAMFPAPNYRAGLAPAAPNASAPLAVPGRRARLRDDAPPLLTPSPPRSSPPLHLLRGHTNATMPRDRMADLKQVTGWLR